MTRIELLRNAIISRQYGLPPEYSRVAYLESDGRQYIDLGYVPEQNSGVTEIVAETKDIATTVGLWGYVEASYTNHRCSMGITSGRWFAGVGSTNLGSVLIPDTKTKLVFNRNENTFTINDISIPTTSVTYSRGRFNAFLYARNDSNNAPYTTLFTGRIYSYKEFDSSGTLVINLIPVIHNATEVFGFYDLERRIFLTNQGSGEFFLVAQDVEEYTRIEYIESDGQQWIDTQLPNTMDLIFEDRFMLTYIVPPPHDTPTIVPNDGHWILGGRVRASDGLGIFRGSYGLFNCYGSSSISYPTDIMENMWVDMYFSRETLTTTVNGNTTTFEVNDGTLISKDNETNVLLGKNQINYYGTGDDPRNMYGRRAMTRITNAANNEVLRDMFPVRLNTSGRVGMWDNITNSFFGSMGPREFTAGPDII